MSPNDEDTYMAEEKNTKLQTIAGLLIAAAAGWYFFGGGLEKQAADDLQNIHNQVAADAVKQHEIAKRSGTPMDTCVQAGLVSAAYLQAKDEPNYRQWKQTEQKECERAGVPR